MLLYFWVLLLAFFVSLISNIIHFILLKFSPVLFLFCYSYFLNSVFSSVGLFGFIPSLFFHSNFNSYCLNFFMSVFLSLIPSPPLPSLPVMVSFYKGWKDV